MESELVELPHEQLCGAIDNGGDGERAGLVLQEVAVVCAAEMELEV